MPCVSTPRSSLKEARQLVRAFRAVAPHPRGRFFSRGAPSPRRAILESIEEQLRLGTSDIKTPCLSVAATPAGPVLLAASSAVPESEEEVGEPNTASRRTRSPSTTRLPADRGNHTNSKNFQSPRVQPAPPPSFAGENQAAGSSFSGRGRRRSKEESGRSGRAGWAMGAEGSVRSVGTVVAHFPTAVATRSVARGKKATKRAWG